MISILIHTRVIEIKASHSRIIVAEWSNQLRLWLSIGVIDIEHRLFTEIKGAPSPSTHTHIIGADDSRPAPKIIEGRLWGCNYRLPKENCSKNMLRRVFVEVVRSESVFSTGTGPPRAVTPPRALFALSRSWRSLYVCEYPVDPYFFIFFYEEGVPEVPKLLVCFSTETNFASLNISAWFHMQEIIYLLICCNRRQSHII